MCLRVRCQMRPLISVMKYTEDIESKRNELKRTADELNELRLKNDKLTDDHSQLMADFNQTSEQLQNVKDTVAEMEQVRNVN